QLARLRRDEHGLGPVLGDGLPGLGELRVFEAVGHEEGDRLPGQVRHGVLLRVVGAATLREPARRDTGIDYGRAPTHNPSRARVMATKSSRSSRSRRSLSLLPAAAAGGASPRRARGARATTTCLNSRPLARLMVPTFTAFTGCPSYFSRSRAGSPAARNAVSSSLTWWRYIASTPTSPGWVVTSLSRARTCSITAASCCGFAEKRRSSGSAPWRRYSAESAVARSPF